jgi:hypothetical protein
MFGSGRTISEQRRIVDQISAKLDDKEHYERELKSAEDALRRAQLNTTATRLLDIRNAQKASDKANHDLERINREIEELKSQL